MPYCSVFEVKSLIDTTKSDAEIVSLIRASDSFIDNMLNGTSAPAVTKSDWSSRLTAFKIQSMSTMGGITGTDVSNVSKIRIGDAEIQTGGTTSSSASNRSGGSGDWRSQVIEEIRTYIRGCRVARS